MASTEFISASAAQSKSLGFQPAMVFVQHPIQDRSDDELRALADGAVDRIVQAITAAPPAG